MAKWPECVASVRHHGWSRLADDLQQRPHHGVRRPGVVVGGAGDLGDERVRVPELDPRTHAVGTRTAAEDVGQALAQPPLDAAGWHQDQLHREGIVEGPAEEGAKTVGEEVGPLGTVKVKRHLTPA